MRSLAAACVVALPVMLSCAKKHDDAPPPSEQPASTEPQRPPWITVDKPGTGACNDHGGELYCVGVSPPSPDKGAAKQATFEMAYDAMAQQLARDAVAAGNVSMSSAEARKQLDAAMNDGNVWPPDPVDWYSEKSKDGIVGFARYVLPIDARKGLTAQLAGATPRD